MCRFSTTAIPIFGPNIAGSSSSLQRTSTMSAAPAGPENHFLPRIRQPSPSRLAVVWTAERSEPPCGSDAATEPTALPSRTAHPPVRFGAAAEPPQDRHHGLRLDDQPDTDPAERGSAELLGEDQRPAGVAVRAAPSLAKQPRGCDRLGRLPWEAPIRLRSLQQRKHRLGEQARDPCPIRVEVGPDDSLREQQCGLVAILRPWRRLGGCRCLLFG
ncbi:MAG: hypothetical protein AABM43_08895 [Actinomycetota bacterium]